MTGIGEDATRCANQSSRVSIIVAMASSGGRTAGSVRPPYRMKSRFGSSAAASSATSMAERAVRVPRLASPPYPVTSSGLRALANGGSAGAIAACVCGEKSGIEMPCALAASAMMSHAPPDAVSTPIRLPRGALLPASSAAVVSSSSRLVTRMMFICRSAALTTASSPATEPVCASAACCPAGLEPTLSATIGLPAASARAAAWANLTGSPISSRNRQITLVASSSTK